MKLLSYSSTVLLSLILKMFFFLNIRIFEDSSGNFIGSVYIAKLKYASSYFIYLITDFGPK